MGFKTTASTVSITAKLTPLGRVLYAKNNNSLITSFSLIDSDANYKAVQPLATGEVPSEGGNIGPNSSISNSTTQNVNFKSLLILNGNGVLKKAVESNSITINSDIALNGETTVTGSTLTQNMINRGDYILDSLVNLYYTFGLPLNASEDGKYTGVTYANGGYVDTAISGIAQSNIVVFGIDNSTYGESIDGKTIKLVLPTTAATYTIYSTYQNKGAKLASEDGNYRDTSTITSKYGSNIAFLFSDDIQKPNNDTSLSWGTGYGTVKPFSSNKKSLYNFQTNTNVGVTADTVVGIAYLDYGFIVITNPTIVTNYGAVDITGTTTGTSITFNSISTNVYQNITCIAGRGEFGATTNYTFTGLESPRISGIALWDVNGNLIAVGKSDRHIVKNVNEFLALGVKISL